MKKTKAFRMIGFILVLTTVFSLLGALGYVGAVAVEESIASSETAKENKVLSAKDGENTLESTFSGKTVDICKYIYNLDDSADYIYVAFEEGGYALFSRDTMEMMEYSMQGALPYSNSSAKNYYAGPTNYLQKNNSKFVDLQTNKVLDITNEEAVTFSQQARTQIKSQTAYRTNITVEKNSILDEVNSFLGSVADMQTASTRSGDPPEYDGNNLIQASLGSGATLIPNYRYFVINPTHGINEGNTCAPIAAQLLLGYHNYYNHREIIEDRFLDGYDDETNTVVTPQYNPNHCTDPMEMAEFILGTRSHTEGENSFYLEMISRIMEPNDENGAAPEDTKKGIEAYLSDHLEPSEYLVDYEEISWWFGYSPIDSSIIKGEINAGRPIIISLGEVLGGLNHATVGYGYQNFTYGDGSGTYEGYIVHMGWEEDEACIWVNSAWCDGYVSLKINHTHSYFTVGPISGTNRTEYRCTDCGHRTDAAFHMTASTSYMENVASIPQNGYNYKDFYVTFDTPGRKLFLTFGNKDAQIYLYDTENNQLAFNDDDGLDCNALFYYTVEANKPYILRVKFYDPSETGDVKLAVTPASRKFEFYDQIKRMTGTGEAWCFDLHLGKTYILTFTPSASGSYKIWTVPADDIDTTIYVVDATSTSACIYDDNIADGLQATVTTNLTAGKSYFIVVSTHDIATEAGFVDFYVSKVS